MNETDEAYEARLDAERKATRAKRCSGCGRKLKPSFKATPDPLDWLFPDCDTCGDEFCPACCTVDDDGKRECFACYESSLHAKG
jgi:hypothetical protein